MARKSRHEEEDEMGEDDDRAGKSAKEEDDDEEDDGEDTIGLDEAEEEEEDDDEDDDEDEEGEEKAGLSVEELERKRLFQGEAEEILESLTLDEVKEVLSDNELSVSLAPRLKKLLVEVIGEGEVTSMDDAWDEALERLEE